MNFLEFIFKLKHKRDPTEGEVEVMQKDAQESREAYKERFGAYPEDDPLNPLNTFKRLFLKVKEKSNDS